MCFNGCLRPWRNSPAPSNDGIEPGKFAELAIIQVEREGVFVSWLRKANRFLSRARCLVFKRLTRTSCRRKDGFRHHAIVSLKVKSAASGQVKCDSVRKRKDLRCLRVGRGGQIEGTDGPCGLTQRFTEFG